VETALTDAERARESARSRLMDRGFDPDDVIAAEGPGAGTDVAGFYDILGVMSASEKAGQSPAYALARLALHAALSNEIADHLFLAYNQQSAEEAGHGDKVFGNAYFAMGGAAPECGLSVFGNGDYAATPMQPSDDPLDNNERLRAAAARIGGIETVALQQLFPMVTALCEAWKHPIGRDLALQIRDTVRPEESRHVLIWRYVFHRVVAPAGAAAIEAYLRSTNVGRARLGAPALHREAFTRMLGTTAPTVRQLLGKERVIAEGYNQ
jgi:hypothetical protein